MTRIGSLACSASVFFGRAKVKSPYFTSVARNGHLTNKPETDGALILTPPPPNPPRPLSPTVLLRFTRKGKKSKEGFEVSHNRTGDLPQRRLRTNQLRETFLAFFSRNRHVAISTLPKLPMS